MHKSYMVYLAIVSVILTVCAMLLHGIGLADITSAFGAFFGALYEARWLFFALFSIVGLTILGSMPMYIIWPCRLSAFAGSCFGGLSFFVLASNIPYFIPEYETVPADWQTNLTLLGLVWAFLILAAVGRLLFPGPGAQKIG